MVDNYSNYTNINGEEIYTRLKEDILTLKLKPGQMISENAIAAEYNVSRTPIKTAFLRLKGEKYIEIIPQKGSFITLLDIRYIQDVIYMRSVLEFDMLNSIIDNGYTSKVIALLEENMEKQSDLLNSAEITPTAFYEIDSAFHYILFDTMERRKMMDIIQDCQVYYTRFRLLDTLTTARYSELYREHENILNALKAENKELLKEAMFYHLQGNLQKLAPKIEGEFKEYFVQH